MKKRKSGCMCGGTLVKDIFINDKDGPEIMEEQLLSILGSLADTVGIDMFKKVVTQAVQDHCRAEKQRKEMSPREAYTKLIEQVEEIDDHLNELDEYVAEWMNNSPDGADMSELDDRLSHIENFLAEKCSGFVPLEDESDKEPNDED